MIYLSDISLSALVFHIEAMLKECNIVSRTEAMQILEGMMCIDDSGRVLHKLLLHKLGSFHMHPLKCSDWQYATTPWALMRPKERPTAVQVIKLCDYYLNTVDAGAVKGPAAPAIRKAISVAPEYKIVKWLMATTAIASLRQTRAYEAAGWGDVTQFEHHTQSTDGTDVFTIL